MVSYTVFDHISDLSQLLFFQMDRYHVPTGTQGKWSILLSRGWKAFHRFIWEEGESLFSLNAVYPARDYNISTDNVFSELVESLSLQGSYAGKIHSIGDAFRNFKNLRSLDLSRNLITSLKVGSILHDQPGQFDL